MCEPPMVWGWLNMSVQFRLITCIKQKGFHLSYILPPDSILWVNEDKVKTMMMLERKLGANRI